MSVYEEISLFYESARTEKRIIGKSWFGRNLYAVKWGEGSPVGIALYAIHGREFITARLAVEQYRFGGLTGCVWFVPLANPDGAEIACLGVESVPKERREEFLRRFGEAGTFGGAEYSLWKANGRGVDLNVNFDADWGTGVKNVRFRGSENCIGDFPFSERESLAIKNFTEEIAPDYTVSYHTKGEEIYWRYFQEGERLKRDFRIASALAGSTGYPLRETAGSAGGYKDWCVQKLKIPALTVEVGKDGFAHPLGGEAWEDIKAHNLHGLQVLSKAVERERFWRGE